MPAVARPVPGASRSEPGSGGQVMLPGIIVTQLKTLVGADRRTTAHRLMVREALPVSPKLSVTVKVTV